MTGSPAVRTNYFYFVSKGLRENAHVWMDMPRHFDAIFTSCLTSASSILLSSLMSEQNRQSHRCNISVMQYMNCVMSSFADNTVRVVRHCEKKYSCAKHISMSYLLCNDIYA